MSLARSEAKLAMVQRLEDATGDPVSLSERQFLWNLQEVDERFRDADDDLFREILNLYRQSKLLHRPEPRLPVAQHEEDTKAPKPHSDSWRDVEKARATVLSRQIARTAEQSAEVKAIRKELHGDQIGLCSESEAGFLLRSPALQFVGREELARLGIALLDHRAEATQTAEGVSANGPWVDYMINIEDRIHVKRRLSWRESEWLSYHDPDQGTLSFRVHRDSYLGGLIQTARRIAPYYMWTEESTLRFILTGYATMHPALKVSPSLNLSQPGDFEFASITLTVQPFVSPRSVKTAYARAQRRLLGHRKGRETPVSNLQVLDFVRSRIALLGHRPTWRQLMKEWNATFRSAWRYKDHHRMRQDYTRTEKRVLFPGYSPSSGPTVTKGPRKRKGRKRRGPRRSQS